MTKLRFRYSMKLSYSEPVENCSFTVKCIPCSNRRQTLEQYSITIEPETSYSESVDGFGNVKIIGSVLKRHESFSIEVSGDVTINQVLHEEIADIVRSGVFRYPYGKTVPGPKITEYADLIKKEYDFNNVISTYDKAVYLMRKLHNIYTYEKKVTDVDTSAEEAFEIGSGVCQDYAHVYISLARLLGMPARYVTGLVIGEGQSHAWVEVLCDDKWIGLDPTNNLLVNDEFVKFGHGRDATDCKINLGIMRGGGNQQQEIDVKVWKE